MYDVIIVGAGPAGLFAAYKLGTAGQKVLVIEKGKSAVLRNCPLTMPEAETACRKCSPCCIMSGVGGAGLFSDGKLILAPKIGKTDLLEFVSVSDADSIISEVDEVLTRHGAVSEYYPTDMDKADEIVRISKAAGIDFIIAKQKHIGSDKLRQVILNFCEELTNNGVEFLLEREVVEIKKDNDSVSGVMLDDGSIIESRFVVLAPGRIGSEWVIRECGRLNIEITHRAIEVGVRVEVPFSVMKPFTDIIWDPLFLIHTEKYDDQVRTFCTNPEGFVTIETYDGFSCVNGYACKDRKSKNTNFAFLSNVRLTEPVEDTIKYGTSIGKLANTIGGKKPILQRYIDLKSGRRSTWERISKSYIEPTLHDVTPGDLAMAMPYRIISNMIDGLEKLNKIIPGVASDSTLLYGPEIKFFSVKVKSDKNLETGLQNLFIAGDGVGVCGNIIGAAATGIIAARGILKKIK